MSTVCRLYDLLVNISSSTEQIKVSEGVTPSTALQNRT